MVNIPFSIQVYMLNGHPTDTINARELFDFLEPSSDFVPWFALHVERYKLEEGRDYSIVRSQPTQEKNSLDDSNNLNSDKQDYFISLDVVTIFAAVDCSTKGKQLRYDLHNFAHADDAKEKNRNLVALPAADMMNLLRLLRHYQGLAVELPQAPLHVNELLERMKCVNN